ncbi:MAG: hypothetical protein PHT07_23670 [Paludibacter sp.]|nr:hypothetical protein [Paludibacter sp.]
MKRSIWLVVLIMLASMAFSQRTYNKAAVYMNDGSVKTSKFAILWGETDKYLYCADKDERNPTKIPSDSARKIVYFYENEKVTYDRLKVYKGWAQKNIGKDAVWLNRLDSGVVRLYSIYTELSAPGTMTNAMITNWGGKAKFTDYYLIRDNEPAAKLYATISSLNNNQTFKAKAPLYFVDYPELAEKITNKEYTWKNLKEVVKIYNEWAKSNRK